jgi:hypothetical protein
MQVGAVGESSSSEKLRTLIYEGKKIELGGNGERRQRERQILDPPSHENLQAPPLQIFPASSVKQDPRYAALIKIVLICASYMPHGTERNVKVPAKIHCVLD